MTGPTHLKLLERKGTDPEAITAVREQIDRASHFVDELLRYGRPRPLELRRVDLRATVAPEHEHDLLRGRGASVDVQPSSPPRVLDAAPTSAGRSAPR